MKAPGLGRLCLPWKIKVTIVLSMFAHSGIPRYAGAVLLVIDDPRASVYFRGMAKRIARLAEQSTD